MIFYTRFVWIKKKKDQKVVHCCCFTQNQNNWVFKDKVILEDNYRRAEVLFWNSSHGLFLPMVVCLDNWSWHQNRAMKLSPHFGYYFVCRERKNGKNMRTTIQFYKDGCQNFSVHLIKVWRTFLRHNTQFFKMFQIGYLPISQKFEGCVL